MANLRDSSVKEVWWRSFWPKTENRKQKAEMEKWRNGEEEEAGKMPAVPC
jgi:hypothetical protein